MEKKSVKVLLPIFSSFDASVGIHFLYGYVVSTVTTVTIYITHVSSKQKEILEDEECDTIVGICSSNSYSHEIWYKNWIMLDYIANPCIKKLVINNNVIDTNKNSIIILYDNDKVKNSETFYDCSNFFWKLKNFLNKENHQIEHASNSCIKKINIYKWMSSSMTAQHMKNCINLIFWLVYTVKKSKKVHMKQGNFILALIFDLILGVAALYFLSEDKAELNSILKNLLEKLVNLLYSLLKWLMGAPAGLKLNNAFNKMLGNFFSYHIKLWWLFLDVSGEKFNVILLVYSYLGYLGITLQVAILADMIYVATFHSYCIYVYAARLFNMQISGLIALMRLFVGRKYNPLRKCVDSCEYTNEELFVGTVAFTILLLLLPTTTMYYIVFALFRLMSLLIQYSLAKIIYWIQTMPLYVVGLWSIHSSKLAGEINLEVVNEEKEAPLVLKATLSNKPLCSFINKFRPPVELSKTIDWTHAIYSLFTGKQII